jgi:hypothetical protein
MYRRFEDDLIDELIDEFITTAPSTARALLPRPRRIMEDEFDFMEDQFDFGSPQQAARQVRANFVSCNRPSTAIAAITGLDPVGTIQAANTRAIELLDSAINELQTARDRVRGGAAPISISAGVRQALQNRFRMNGADRNIWTGTGARTVLTLIRRLRGARQILADGWMRYTCLGGATFPLGSCLPGSCNVPGRRALSCAGHSRIVLCAPWWSDGLDDQAATLLHEAIHIYFGFIRDTGNFVNAHCYEQFVLDLNGLVVPAEFAGGCP